MSINFRTIFYLIVISVLLLSCDNRPDNVLSKQEMTDFLVDMHKLDGTLVAKGMGNYDNRQNVYYYNALLRKYGITKAQFDSSLVWYTKNPKKFEKIYVDVVDRLTKLDALVKSGYFHQADTAALRNMAVNIWPLKRTKFQLTKDSVHTAIKFSINNGQLAWGDIYKFSFLHRSVKSRDSKGQQTIIRIHYADKVVDSVLCKINSDSVLRRYTITLKARRQHRIDSLSGKFTNCEGTKTYIDSLKLIRHFDSIAQDSINKVVYLIENPIPQSYPLKTELRLRSKVILQRQNEKPQ